MREIKFRAWNKENEKMIYSNETYPRSIYKFEFDIVSNFNFKLTKMVDRFNVKSDDGEDYYIECYEPIDADIMQYTGLKDYDNNEIYEGDIVKTSTGVIGIVRFGRYSATNINGISNIGFYIEWKLDICMRIDLGYWLERISVIGNIYENPELLG